MKEKRTSLCCDNAHLHVTGCSLINSVERYALIYPALCSTSPLMPFPVECGAERVHVSALLHEYQTCLCTRGGLIDHQPGDQVRNQSWPVSSDLQKSDPSSDISAIPPLCLELSADQPTPRLPGPPLRPALSGFSFPLFIHQA